jgi:tetratricopeptide (TPR) repeat protein
MRSVVSIFCALLLALLVSATATPAHAAVRAAEHQGYGRLVFDWDGPVRYAVKVSGRTMTVTFGRPLSGDPRAAIGPLSRYIAAASLSQDGLTATFTLKNDYEANSFTLGASVVVDLRPAGAAAAQANSTPTPTPAPAPAPAASRAPPVASAPAARAPAVTPAPRAASSGSAPRLGVRAGSHEGYERVVFDWPSTVPYTVSSTDSAATVTFSRPATIDLPRLREALPEFLQGVTSETSGRQLSVQIPLPKGGRVRHFTSGPKVVLDVMMSPDQAVQQAEEQDQAPSPQVAALPTKSDEAAVETPAAPAVTAPQAINTPTTAESKSPAAEALDRALREQVQGQPEKAPAAPVTPPAATDAEPADDYQPPKPEKGSLVASLSFPWDKATAAAVFQRGPYYWVVFDRHQDADIPLLKKLGGKVVHHVEQIPSASATVIRLLVEPGYNASVRREGLLWIVDFMRQPYRPTRPVEVTPQPRSPVGPRLFLPVAEGGRAMVLLDPEVGDRFIAVPVVPLGTGVFPAHAYPDADLPVTVQGVLVEPHSDQVVVNSTRNGVDVTAPGGLTFSTNLAEMKAMAQIGTNTNLTKVLDIGAWMRGGEENFNETKQMLEMAVAQAPDTRRNPARLELARFYFANGYEAEALGILSVIEKDSPDLANSAAVKALHGAASFMMGRWSEAVRDFSHPSLASIEEASFWRALAQAELGSPELQAQTVRDFGGVIGDYPRRVKVPLAIQAALVSVAAADDLATNNFLAAAQADDNTTHELAAMTYIEGKLASAEGNFDVAIEKWGELEDSTDRYFRAVAIRDRLEMLYRMEQLDRPNLIKGLERLRFAWRGGPFELSLLMRLGDLYTEEGDYGKALRVWQQAATYFEGQSGAELAMGRMRETFDKLYYDGLADGMTPLRAIALYDEFRELTPTGPKGDEMIRRLADRLVSVDLLQQAAALLERQVKYRLSGADKAKVGARLGLVYLLDREPEKAVAALLESKSPTTPEPLERQRQQLLARGLADLGRSDEAVVLLEGDSSRNADLLRAEIEWKSGNWAKAAEALSNVVPKASPSLVLTDEQAMMVLDWATALTLSEDEQAVAVIRNRYGAAMDRTSYKEAFDLITTPPESGVIDYRTVSDRIKQAEDFKSFLAAYRERLRSEGLSGIN